MTVELTCRQRAFSLAAGMNLLGRQGWPAQASRSASVAAVQRGRRAARARRARVRALAGAYVCLLCLDRVGPRYMDGLGRADLDRPLQRSGIAHDGGIDGSGPYVKGWKSVVSMDKGRGAVIGRLMRHDLKSCHHDTKTRPRRLLSLASLLASLAHRFASPPLCTRMFPNSAARSGIRFLQHHPVWTARWDVFAPSLLNLAFGPAARHVQRSSRV